MSDGSPPVLPELPEVKENDSTANKAFKIGSYLRTHHKFYALSERSAIWMYNPKRGIWENDGLNFIQNFLANYLSRMYSTHLLKEIQNYVRFTSYNKEIQLGGPAHRIVMKNGTYDLNEFKFYPEFFPDEHHISVIPVKYKPGSKCPKIKNFLDELHHKEDDIRSIEEMFGYCLYKDYPFAIVINLLGEGDNGKSTLIELFESFVGKENCSAVTPQQLEDKFKIAQLHGKLLNIAGDVPVRAYYNTGFVKMLTGKDLITAEHKNLAPFEFKNYSKLIFSMNQLPATPDNTRAFHKRMRIIEYKTIFSADDPNTIPSHKLLKTLTTQEELSGLFNLAIEGWKRLDDRGRLTGEKTVEEKEIIYGLHSDSVDWFIHTRVIISPNRNPIDKQVLFDYYRYECNLDGGKSALGYNVFTKKIKGSSRIQGNLEEPQVNDESGKKRRWYGGIGLIDEEAFTDFILATGASIASSSTYAQNYGESNEGLPKIASFASSEKSLEKSFTEEDNDAFWESIIGEDPKPKKKSKPKKKPKSKKQSTKKGGKK